MTNKNQSKYPYDRSEKPSPRSKSRRHWQIEGVVMKTMICPECGADDNLLDDGDKCPNCGRKISI